MQRRGVLALLTVALVATSLNAQQAPADAPYQVLKRAKVGGEGGSDYIFADVEGRRLYIPRGGTRAVPATDTSAARPAAPGRITVFDLESLAPVGEIPGTGGNGVAIDPKSGHGFSSSKPVSMFDTKTLKLIRTIDVGAAQPDGILFDSYNDRIYVFSHPTKDAIVINSSDGRVLGTIDLGGVPEQGVADGRGTLYVVMQDAEGSVTKVDVNTMTVTAHYTFGDKGGGCNGLALDDRTHVLFAACARSGAATTQPPMPQMVILSADDGQLLATLPLAGSSDGAAFNPATNEAFSTHSNGTMTVVKELTSGTFGVSQNLNTMLGARTLSLDPKTGRIYAMSVERAPVPPGTPAGPGGRPPVGPVIPGSFTVLVIGR